MKKVLFISFLFSSIFAFSQSSEDISLYIGGGDRTYQASGASDLLGCEDPGPNENFPVLGGCGKTLEKAFTRGRYLITGAINKDNIFLSGNENDYTSSFTITPIEEFSTVLQENYVTYYFYAVKTKKCEVGKGQSYPITCTPDNGEPLKVISTEVVKTYRINIEKAPALKSQDAIVFCKNDPEVNLFNYVTKEGGFFIINGAPIDGTSFNPASLAAGTHIAEYRKIYTNGETTLAFKLQINDVPNISLNATGDICSTAQAFNLNERLLPVPFVVTCK